MAPIHESNERLGLLLGFVGVAFFSLTMPITHVAIAEMDAWFVIFARGFLASVAAALLLWAAGEAPPPRELWPSLIVSSAGVVFGFPIGVTLAMQYTTAAHGAVVLALLPLATAVFGAAIGGERPSLGFWLCALIGTLAVAAFAVVRAGGALGALHAADLLLMFTVVTASIGYTYGAMLTRSMGGWQVICWSLVVAAPLLLAGTVTLLLLEVDVGWDASARAWASFLYLAFGTQILAFFAWYRGLAIGGVARVSQIQLTQPFLTFAAAVLLLGENVTLVHIAFALVVVTTVAVGRRMHVARPSGGTQ